MCKPRDNGSLTGVKPMGLPMSRPLTEGGLKFSSAASKRMGTLLSRKMKVPPRFRRVLSVLFRALYLEWVVEELRVILIPISKASSV